MNKCWLSNIQVVIAHRFPVPPSFTLLFSPSRSLDWLHSENTLHLRTSFAGDDHSKTNMFIPFESYTKDCFLNANWWLQWCQWSPVTRALYLGYQSLPKWSTLCFLSFREIWGFLSMSLRVFNLWTVDYDNYDSAWGLSAVILDYCYRVIYSLGVNHSCTHTHTHAGMWVSLPELRDLI